MLKATTKGAAPSDALHHDHIDIEVPPVTPAMALPKGVIPLICALTLVGNRLGGGVVGLPFAIKTVGYTTAI